MVLGAYGDPSESEIFAHNVCVCCCYGVGDMWRPFRKRDICTYRVCVVLLWCWGHMVTLQKVRYSHKTRVYQGWETTCGTACTFCVATGIDCCLMQHAHLACVDRQRGVDMAWRHASAQSALGRLTAPWSKAGAMPAALRPHSIKMHACAHTHLLHLRLRSCTAP